MNKHIILKFFEKSGRIMKRIEVVKGSKTRSKTLNTTLILIGAVLLVAGIIFLLIEPIKRYNRQKMSQEALTVISEKIVETKESEMTYVVPAIGNEVEGEGYDFIGEEEPEATPAPNAKVVLNSIGILNISKIKIKYSVWDEATKVSLRYGPGHYGDSVMPGEVGNATILGHNYRDGSMFHKLGQLKKGDKVVFTGKDGKEKVFYVEESKIVKAADLMKYTTGDITDKRQLTLVTCTYEYGRKGWRRVVICRMKG